MNELFDNLTTSLLKALATDRHELESQTWKSTLGNDYMYLRVTDVFENYFFYLLVFLQLALILAGS